MLTRREMLSAALLSAAALAALRAGRAQTPPARLNEPPPAPGLVATFGPYSLPPLPYAYDALEPYIDARTMQTHHDKHHFAYVNNLNAAVVRLPVSLDAAGTQVRDGGGVISGLLSGGHIGITDPADPVFKAIRNNGGGHYNHSLFWRLMKKNGGGRPTKDLASALDKRFGSYPQFQQAFTKAALGQFGSGWAWLSLAPGGALSVEALPNQDSPLMHGRTPILGIDVWEHAYYLKYQNRRAEYVAAWYNTLDWEFINGRFSQAVRGA